MIRVVNLDPNDPDHIKTRLFAANSQADRVALHKGSKAIAVLYLPSNVVNGETVTINGDVFEVDIINTSTTRTNVGAIDGTSDPVQITLSAAPALAIAAGDLIRIDNEIMKCRQKFSTTVYSFARGRCGTTKASHLTGQTVYQSDAAPTNIPVGLVTTLTPAVFGPALINEFNNPLMADNGERVRSKASTQFKNYTANTLVGLNVGQEIVFEANVVGADSSAVASTLSGSNVWSAATFTGGVSPGIKGIGTQVRVPTATEETLGEMHFAFGFPVRAAVVSMYITATNQRVFFNGAVIAGYGESTDAQLGTEFVTIRNVGPASTAYITPFSASHTVIVHAWE